MPLNRREFLELVAGSVATNLVSTVPPITQSDLPFKVGPSQPDREPLIASEFFERLYSVVMRAIEAGHLQPQHGLFSETA